MARHRQGRIFGALWSAWALCWLCGGCTALHPGTVASSPLPGRVTDAQRNAPPTARTAATTPVLHASATPREPRNTPTSTAPAELALTAATMQDPNVRPALHVEAAAANLPDAPLELPAPQPVPAAAPLALPSLPCPPAVPRENAKILLPPYVIEPPDILVIDALRLVPKPPYHIEAQDALALQVTETLPEQPIAGVYPVEPEGTINLLYNYGMVSVVGLTLEQARVAVEKHLTQYLKPGFKVNVALARSAGMQQIRGEHLVHPDGTVNLGSYGSVVVAGLTIVDARAAIEAHLAQFLLEPKVSVDVAAFNSKVYYVVTDGASFGEQVIRLPITGSETVLDAVSAINGLSPVSSKWRIFIARPDPAHPECARVLPVDWNAIVRKGITRTNYQILPGDRLYINSQPLVKFDNILAKVYGPVERTFGILLLGNTTVNALQGKSLNTSSP